MKQIRLSGPVHSKMCIVHRACWFLILLGALAFEPEKSDNLPEISVCVVLGWEMCKKQGTKLRTQLKKSV